MKKSIEPILVHLFGPFRISSGNDYIPLGISGVTRQILIYLCLHPGTRFRRDVLSTLFWSDSSTAKGRAALSTAIWRLRKCCSSIPGISVETSENLIWLDIDEQVKMDSQELEYWQRQAQIHRRTDLRLTDQIRQKLISSIEMCEGLFLDGCDQEWSLSAREVAMTLRLNTIQQIIDDAQERSRLSTAIRWAQIGLKDDPFHEWIHHRLIQLYAATSQRSKAILQFETLKSLLAAELGVEPLPETLELRNSIIASSSLENASVVIPGAPTKRSGSEKTALHKI